MTKFMRKYQKWLLAVFGSVLMVIFLVQGTVSSLHADPGDRTYATVYGRAISLNQRGVYDARYAALNQAVPGLLEAFGIKSEDRWFLLVLEARRGGFCGHAGDGRDFMEPLAEMLAPQSVSQSMRGRPIEEQIKILQDRNLQQQLVQQQAEILVARMKNSGAPEDRPNSNTVQGFEIALADLRGILRMLTADLSASRLSDRGVREALSEQESSVVADAIILDAEPLIASMPPAAPAELAAQFEKARSIDPTKAADGIGYVLPQRVKVQWIAVDKTALSKAVKLDDIAVNKHWRQDRKTYPGEFSVEKPRIEAAMIEEQAQRLLSEIDRAIKSQVTLAVKDLPESNGLRTLPDNWATARPSLAVIATKVAEAVKAATGVDIPTPAVESRDTWMTAKDLGTLPGIGASVLRLGTASVPFTKLAFQVHELKPEKPAATLQVGIPFVATPLQNSAGDHFTFVIDAVKESAPAESLDEVRERVAHDVLALKAYEKLVSNVEAFKALAVSDGLEAVGKLAVEGTAAAAPKPKLRVTIPHDETRRNDPDLGDKDVADALWQAGSTLDPLVEQTKDTLAARTVAVARPNARKVVVAQVLQYRPLTVEDVRRLDPTQLMRLRQREISDVFGKETIPSAYTLDALKARMKFVVVDKETRKKKK